MADQLLAKRKRKRRWCVAAWLTCCLIAFILWHIGAPYGLASGTGIWFVMEVWQHDRLSRVVHQLTADPERATNVKIEVTPAVALARTELEPYETDERDLIP